MNFPTFAVVSAVTAALVAIAVSAARSRKRGKSRCSGGGCPGCPWAGHCPGA